MITNYIENLSVEDKYYKVMIGLRDARWLTEQEAEIIAGERFVVTEFIDGEIEGETLRIPSRITRDFTEVYIQYAKGLVFDIFNCSREEHLSWLEMSQFGQETVPLIDFNFVVPNMCCEDIITHLVDHADIPSSIDETGRAYGVVLRPVDHKKTKVALGIRQDNNFYDGIFVPNMKHKCFKK